MERLAAACRWAVRTVSPPRLSARSGRLQIWEAVFEGQGRKHIHQVLGVVLLRSLGLNQQLCNGKTNQKEEKGKMEERRREETGDDPVVLRPGLRAVEAQCLERSIPLPNHHQRFAERAVTWTLAGQELWSLVLHRPPNLSYHYGGIPPLGFSKRAPTNEETGRRTLPKPGHYPAANLQSESACNRPGQAETPSCRLF